MQRYKKLYSNNYPKENKPKWGGKNPQQTIPKPKQPHPPSKKPARTNNTERAGYL